MKQDLESERAAEQEWWLLADLRINNKRIAVGFSYKTVVLQYWKSRCCHEGKTDDEQDHSKTRNELAA